MQFESFREYCVVQIERLGGAFPDFRFYKAGAVEELVNWLESKAAGDKAKATGLITEVCEFENLPKIADLNAVWRRLFPPVESSERLRCQICNGTGWEEVAVNGYTGVRRCQCSTAVSRN
jgi:hypothetical protein